MEIKLLAAGYKTDEKFYNAFIADELSDSEFVSDDSVWISGQIPDFPIYFPGQDKKTREEEFLPAIRLIDKYVINLDRDYFMDECFWHSLVCLYKREYLLEKYPQIKTSYKEFTRIVIKPFDWQNYIYKAILIAQYVADNRADQKEKYYNLILDNMDMFNYIIKYEIFRNGTFLINIMDIIEETGLSTLLKARIKNRPDLGADERYGRRVILELNKSYPIIMSPMLEKEELKQYFLKFLSYYTEEQAAEEAEEEPFLEEPIVGEVEEPIVEVKREDEPPVEEPIVGEVEKPIVEMKREAEPPVEEPIVGKAEKPIVEELHDNVVLEEKPNIDMSVSNDNHEDILSAFSIWLKKNRFIEFAIKQYVSHIREIDKYWMHFANESFLGITDIDEIDKVRSILPEKYVKGKFATALKYYKQFVKDNK